MTRLRDQMKYLALFAALIAAGCASDIMEGYVGRDITAVVANYGAPYRTFDVPGGRVAYQWRIIEHSDSPQEIDFNAARDGDAISGQVTISEARSRSHTCYYTFYTRRNGASVTIVSFERPSFECE